MLFKIKKKFTIIDILIKKDIKKNIFKVLHFFFIVSLIYNSQNSKAPHYEEVIIFISFELFGIIVFYSIKEYIISLENKINLYLLFCFLLVEIFKYFDDIGIEFLFNATLINTFISIIILFIYFIVKKDSFYLILLIVELFWFTIFLFFNLLSSSPDLGNYDINLQTILGVYILGIFLYVKLFKKNEHIKEKEKNLNF